MRCETCNHSECSIYSRPTDITDTRERLTTHNAAQNGETDKRHTTQQTRDHDAIVAIQIQSATIPRALLPVDADPKVYRDEHSWRNPSFGPQVELFRSLA